MSIIFYPTLSHLILYAHIILIICSCAFLAPSSGLIICFFTEIQPLTSLMWNFLIRVLGVQSVW